MATFQTTVLVIFMVLLIITLFYIGYSINKGITEIDWPPIIGGCPDYWVSVSKDGLNSYGINKTNLTGTGPFCVNVKNLGTCPAKAGDKFLVADFTTNTYTGSNGNCAKYNWAKKCGLTWDGITYGVSNPCIDNNKKSSNLLR